MTYTCFDGRLAGSVTCSLDPYGQALWRGDPGNCGNAGKGSIIFDKERGPSICDESSPFFSDSPLTVVKKLLRVSIFLLGEFEPMDDCTF